MGEESFVVPGAQSNRELLITMAPFILGTSKDQRHAHMEKLVGNFKEVFANEEARLQGKVAEAEVKITETTDELASRKAEVDSALAELQVKINVRTALEIALAESVAVTADSETVFKDVQFE